MSNTVTYPFSVNLPTLDEFTSRFPQYGKRATGDGEPLFAFIMSPERFMSAFCATVDFSLPAVAGIANACEKTFGVLASSDKQFVGALVCSLMESNGFVKTGRKKAIPHKDFSKGEVYQLTDTSRIGLAS